MDYRTLLMKYISHVGACEGVDFLSDTFCGPGSRGAHSKWPLTAEELVELRVLNKEADDTIRRLEMEATADDEDDPFEAITDPARAQAILDANIWYEVEGRRMRACNFVDGMTVCLHKSGKLTVHAPGAIIV
jgi:hypothetical protein